MQFKLLQAALGKGFEQPEADSPPAGSAVRFLMSVQQLQLSLIQGSTPALLAFPPDFLTVRQILVVHYIP